MADQTFKENPYDMSKYLMSKKFTDFQIICGEHAFYVHRVIVADRCEYFDRITASGFKESQQQIAKFPDEDPACIARLLYHIYTGQYSATPLASLGIDQFQKIHEPWIERKETILHHAKIHSVAIKYGMDELAAQAARLFEHGIHSSTIHLQKPSWSDLIKYIYESTPSSARALRDEVLMSIQSTKHHTPSLLDMEQLVHLLEKLPEFSIDLATSSIMKKQYSYRQCYTVNRILQTRCFHENKHVFGSNTCLEQRVKEFQCRVCQVVGYFDV